LAEVYCVTDREGTLKFNQKAAELRRKGSRVTGIIENNRSSLITPELESNFAELFEGDAVKILKDLLGVIEQSTHTQYPEEIFCFGSGDFIKRILKVVENYGIKLNNYVYGK